MVCRIEGNSRGYTALPNHIPKFSRAYRVTAILDDWNFSKWNMHRIAESVREDSSGGVLFKTSHYINCRGIKRLLVAIYKHRLKSKLEDSINRCWEDHGS